MSNASLNIKKAKLNLVCGWQHVKDYLCHFSLPHVDLLVWIMFMVLVPRYYQKLNVILNDTSHVWEFSSWRHNFKVAWKKATKTPITISLNEQYRPDSKQIVCTCLQFIISHFLKCKHLIQSFSPLTQYFPWSIVESDGAFLVLFWSHLTLKPPSSIVSDNEGDNQARTGRDEADDNKNEAGHLKGWMLQNLNLMTWNSNLMMTC